jgi:single-stranded-DNA-specific exonuclease
MDHPKKWNVAEPSGAAAQLGFNLNISPLIAQLLINRGMTQPDECRTFLRPSLKLLHDPLLIPQLGAAAQRIAQAIRDKKKIVVYGDYDVDGITGTAILWHAIRTLGGIVDYYIPHRIEEGYGLNVEAVKQICDEGAGLIVTVDCGVTAIAPAAIARERQVDLIISDHHEWHDEGAGAGVIWPDCCAIVHPRMQQEVPYPNPHLCGAGVAFKLAWATGLAVSGAVKVSETFRNYLIDATALAALGTIADVVPLVGENRVLAHFGLGGLKASKLTGIQALIAASGLSGQTLDSYHVGFLLAPKLNAAGRMGHARLAVEMMTTADGPRAAEIATFLEQQNRERQAVEKQILTQALKQAEELNCASDDCRAVVLGGAGWHPGVIGIVASRIVDRFHKPAIIVALSEDMGQGSGRSIPGFHLAKALDACGQHLIGHGGHEMAAGLRLDPKKFEDFRRDFGDSARQTITPDMLVRELDLDVQAELRSLNEGLVNDLKRLGPFGHGNRRPLLFLHDVQVAAPPRRVGKTGDHLQLYVRQGQTSMKCIAFGAGAMCDQLKPGMSLDLAAEPQMNEFNGRTSVELTVKDLLVPEAKSDSK